MTDETEAARRAMAPQMPDHLIDAVARGEQVWDTDALTKEFEVRAFMAPFVIVKRKADGVLGTMKFTHDSRWYFGWQPE